MRHPDLRAHGHQTAREVVEVLGNAPVCDHQVVDVSEGQRTLGLVGRLGLKEGCGVGFPVAPRVKVVRGVVAVVEAVAVALRGVLVTDVLKGGGGAYGDIDEGYAGAEVGHGVHVVD